MPSNPGAERAGNGLQSHLLKDIAPSFPCLFLLYIIGEQPRKQLSVSDREPKGEWVGASGSVFEEVEGEYGEGRADLTLPNNSQAPRADVGSRLG